jgi:hypothetical protein
VWGRNSRQPGKIEIVLDIFSKAGAFGDYHMPVPLALFETKLWLIC